MKAVILAGGYATRLWPITRHRPKMFLPLGDTTVIDRIYAELEGEERIDVVYVSTNERFAEDFATHLGGHLYEKPKLSVEETSAETEKLGVTGALGQLIQRERIDDDLLVIAGDNIIEFVIGSFLAEFDRRGAPTIAVHDVGDADLATAYGVVELDADRVVGFEEKPDAPASTCVSVGCYVLPSQCLSLVRTYLDGDNDPDEIGRFVQWLHSRQPTYAYAFEGAWFDVGTLDSYLDAVEWKLDGDSLIAETASLEHVTVGSNVHVMSGASLVDVDIEHAVVFPEATVEASTVRRSIVDEGAELEGLVLDGAMIGAYTRIRDGSSPTRRPITEE